MTALDGPIADLARYLPVAAVLIAHPDTTPSGPGGKPGSRPPWNAPAANAKYDALAVIADWHAELRYRVTGRTGQRLPASATGAALKAIASLAHAVPRDLVRAAERDLARCVQVIMVLNAVDEAERWEKLRAGADGKRPCCPWCACPNLRVAVRAGLVACVTIDCTDQDGRRPVASMALGAVSGTPMVVGSDGTVWAVAP